VVLQIESYSFIHKAKQMLDMAFRKSDKVVLLAERLDWRVEQSAEDFYSPFERQLLLARNVGLKFGLHRFAPAGVVSFRLESAGRLSS